MVVGDDAQSIYAWRGANFENILRFPKRYPGTKIYKIETNYRSTPEILEVANAAITANEQRFNKELAPARRAGAKPFRVPCYDAKSQALFVARRVLELREEGINLNCIAVLYRSHFHALELQLELTRHQIPFSIASGTRFFEQAHVKDVTSFLKLVLNPRDELSFKRLGKMLPGIGGKAAQKLWAAFELNSQVQAPESKVQSPKSKVDGARSMVRSSPSAEPEGQNIEAVQPQRDLLLSTPIAVALQACVQVVPKKAGVPWAQFVATVAQLEDEKVRNDASKMIRLVMEAGYEEYLKENHSNYRSRLEDLEELSIFAQQFGSLEEFLTQLALLTNLEAEDGQPVPKDDDRLRLSTIHQAKGLEFDVVLVIMLCDGMFPSALSLKSKDNLEEERRLMYVAITRARNELYLCYPLVRSGFGTGTDTTQQASRFLLEIPETLIEEVNLQRYF
jgi:DNA helicase-2/ATP-dependent DNA helicase PcrA